MFCGNVEGHSKEISTVILGRMEGDWRVGLCWVKGQDGCSR